MFVLFVQYSWLNHGVPHVSTTACSTHTLWAKSGVFSQLRPARHQLLLVNTPDLANQIEGRAGRDGICAMLKDHENHEYRTF